MSASTASGSHPVKANRQELSAEFVERFRAIATRRFAENPAAVYAEPGNTDFEWIVLAGGNIGVELGREVGDHAHFVVSGLALSEPTWDLTIKGTRRMAYTYPGSDFDEEELLVRCEQLPLMLPPDVPFGVVEDGMVVAILMPTFPSNWALPDGTPTRTSGVRVYVLEGHDKPSLLEYGDRDYKRLISGLWNALQSGNLVELGKRLNARDLPSGKEDRYVWPGKDAGKPGYLLLRVTDNLVPELPANHPWVDWIIPESYPMEMGRTWSDQEKFVSKLSGWWRELS